MDKSSEELYSPVATEELERFGYSRHVDMGIFGFDDETIPEDQRPAKPQQRDSRLPSPVTFDATLRLTDPALMERLLEVSGFPWENLRKTFREETRQALCLLMVHLWVAARQHDDVLVSIPKNKNHYGNGKTCFGYAAFSRALDHLTGMDALRCHTGGSFDKASGRGLAALYYGAAWFIRLLDPMVSGAGYDAVASDPDIARIVLKDDGKQELPLPNIPTVRRMQSNLREINRAITAHRITFEPPEGTSGCAALLASTRLYRVFNNARLKQGGRFYGGWWQGIAGDLRQHIRIDDEATAEADYKALIAYQLYHEAGMPVPCRDPYRFGFEDHPDIFRQWAKDAFTRLANTPHDKIAAGETFDPAIARMTWQEFVTTLKTHHTPIVHLFHRQLGLKMQYQDSRIAEAVLLHFAKHSKACLPIHDSFIVKQDDLEELVKVMKRAARKVAGLEAVVEVEFDGGEGEVAHGEPHHLSANR